MKLILTSAGFTNKSIASALLELAGKPFSELKLVFIPTASNVEPGGKEWLINDLINCKNLGYKQIDIVDISAIPQDVWLPRINDADVIFVGGGDCYYLMEWFDKSGLTNLMSKFLETKIYVGLSAGSMIVSKWWSTKFDTDLYDEKIYPTDKYDCLGFVNFQVMPHFNGDFPKITWENVEKLSNEFRETIYLLDDQSAVMVNGDKVEVVSEGEWKKFN